MKFTLEIKLGSNGMQYTNEVAEALHAVYSKITDLEVMRTFDELDPFDRSGGIRDANGATVGKWEAVADGGAEPVTPGPAHTLPIRRSWFDRLDDALKAAAPEHWVIAVESTGKTLSYRLTAAPEKLGLDSYVIMRKPLTVL